MVDNAASKPLVTITGVTGYLGTWTAKAYLEDGSYRVRGTVRDRTNAVKIDPLKAHLGEELFAQLELVEADLLNQDSILAALAGSVYVVHTASPFVWANPDDEQVLIRPAVEGTLSVLRACKEYGVQRCAITSSVAAMRNVSPANWPADNTFDESWWSEAMAGPTVINTYSKSKTLAEKAAWDYQESLPEAKRFEIVTLNPALIMGPATQTQDFASAEWIKGVMLGTDKQKRLRLGQVDVRDVAKAHLQAIKVDAAKNRRFLLVSGSAWNREMAQCLANEFNSKGYNVVTEEKTDDKILSYDCNTTASREVLGISYIPLEQSWVEMAHSMIASGLIQAPAAQ